MEDHEIESLAQDLVNDVKGSGVNRIVIKSEGKSQSISPVAFEALKERLCTLLPGVSVVYELSKELPSKSSLRPGA